MVLIHAEIHANWTVTVLPTLQFVQSVATRCAHDRGAVTTVEDREATGLKRKWQNPRLYVKRLIGNCT
jgi:hypothetical protein